MYTGIYHVIYNCISCDTLVYSMFCRDVNKATEYKAKAKAKAKAESEVQVLYAIVIIFYLSLLYVTLLDNQKISDIACIVNL